MAPSFAISLLLALTLTVGAELRTFHNADESKSFLGELTGYDPAKKRVSIRLKNNRSQHFNIDLLSKDDQAYVIKNGQRLAIGNDLRVSLKKFHEKTVKSRKTRIVNRAMPTGYTISLNNRSKKTYSGITINYTLHYAVQDYLEATRDDKIHSGTLKCPDIGPQGRISLNTETIDIISGILDAITRKQPTTDSDGSTSYKTIIVSPGGRRKDLLKGCKIEILLDGEVVKRFVEGSLQIVKEKKNR